LFVKIEDDFGSVEVLVFPNLLKETESIWTEGKGVFLQGKLSDKDQELKVLANNAVALDLKNIEKIAKNLGSGLGGVTAATSSSRGQDCDLKIIFYRNINDDGLARLKEIFGKYPGRDRVFFEIKANGEAQSLETDFKVSNNSILMTELKHRFAGILGLENIAKK